MLPASTPANAIVYGSGKVTVRDMMKAGFWLTLAGIILTVVFVRLLSFF
jgi:sodium-dependent dicarboxylate transporter 2/3/5